MTDVRADLECCARNVCSEVLLLVTRKNTVAVSAEDQHRATDQGKIRCGVGREKAG
jgi:hypothetical protein